MTKIAKTPETPDRFAVHAPDCPDCEGQDAEVKSLLNSAAVEPWPEMPAALRSGLEQSLAAAVQPQRAATGRSHLSWRSRRGTWAALFIAASAAIAFFSTYSFNGSKNAPVAATFAGAQAVVQQARSMHLLEYGREREDDDELTRVTETYYLHGRGMWERYTSKQPGCLPREQIVLTTPDAQWNIYPAFQTAVRRPPGRRIDAALRRVGEKMLLEHINRAQRKPDGDLVIQGARCRLYVASGTAATTQPALSIEEAGKVHLWADDRGAVRRSEHYWFRDGAWKLMWRTEAAFDVTVDENLFSPRFPENYAILEPEHILADMFPLESADAQMEVNGTIVACHNTTRVGDHLLATTVTLRPTAETERKVRAADDPAEMIVAGYCGAGLCVGSFAGRSMYEQENGVLQENQVAQLFDRSMAVAWVLVRPEQSVAPGDTVTLKFSVQLFAEGLQRFADLERAKFAALSLPVPAAAPLSIPAYAAQVHGQFETGAQFDPGMTCMIYGDPFSGECQGQFHHTRATQGPLLRIPREDFCRALLERYREE